MYILFIYVYDFGYYIYNFMEQTLCYIIVVYYVMFFISVSKIDIYSLISRATKICVPQT